MADAFDGLHGSVGWHPYLDGPTGMQLAEIAESGSHQARQLATISDHRSVFGDGQGLDTGQRHGRIAG
jgi:hypothetical protein